MTLSPHITTWYGLEQLAFKRQYIHVVWGGLYGVQVALISINLKYIT